MNASITTPLADETPFAAAPRPKVLPEPPLHFPRLLVGLVVGIAASDICFWSAQDQPGLSLAVICAVVSAVILFNRERAGLGRTTRWLVALLAGALVAAVVETSFTNTMVLIALILALAGESYFLTAGSSWGRWLSQGLAMLGAPGRIFWFAGRLMDVGAKGGTSGTRGVFRALLLTLPALILALGFGSLLSTGNAIFGAWVGNFFNWFWHELWLYLDPWRMFTWFLAGFVLLPLLRPAQIASSMWQGVTSLPRFGEAVATKSAVASSAMVLVVLNLLFLVSNIADALFLWSGQQVPAGVSYQVYVHEGVEALIVTVILSAVVLAVIFQQAAPVAHRRELKLLAYLWIAQNIFLIGSVTKKLWGFVVTYEMTVERLSTIIFLVLVSAGFVLLTIKIRKDRSLSWLIGGCVLATFATFYITQFLDLAGWSADYNVARMEADPARGFDSNTMCQWGPAVWPALRRAHDLDPENYHFSEALKAARNGTDYTRRAQFTTSTWREFSLRAWMNRSAVEEKPHN